LTFGLWPLASWLALAAEASPVYTIFIALPFFFSQSFDSGAYHATHSFLASIFAEVPDERSIHARNHAGIVSVDDRLAQDMYPTAPETLR
jgi:hypothetical protein